MHTIHLRHPWQCELCEGRVRWSRHFNWPAGVLPQETVWLVVDPLPASAMVQLNGGHGLSASSDRLPTQFDVTSIIAERNQVVVELAGQGDEVRFPLSVRLEIDEG